MTPSSQPAAVGFISELEATRGIAALLVAGYHVCGTPVVLNGETTNLIEAASQSASTIERLVANLFWTVMNGDLAVLYFFVLSGFVLSLSLQRNEALTAGTAFRFGIRRLFRVYPAVIFAVLAFFVVRSMVGGSQAAAFDGVAVVRNMLLLDVNINGVMWTMQTELIAAPLVFVCVAIAAGGRTPWLIAIAAGLAVLSFVPAWTGLFAVNDISRTMPLYAFAFGVLAHAKGRDVLRYIASRYNGPILALAIVMLFASAQLPLGAAAVALIQVMASTVIVTLVAFARWKKPLAPLTAPGARLIGRISFSFYLLHPLTLLIVWPMAATWTSLVAAGVPPIVLILMLWIAMSAVIVPLAMVSYRYVERPANAYGRWITERLRTRGALVNAPAR